MTREPSRFDVRQIEASRAPGTLHGRGGREVRDLETYGDVKELPAEQAEI